MTIADLPCRPARARPPIGNGPDRYQHSLCYWYWYRQRGIRPETRKTLQWDVGSRRKERTISSGRDNVVISKQSADFYLYYRGTLALLYEVTWRVGFTRRKRAGH